MHYFLLYDHVAIYQVTSETMNLISDTPVSRGNTYSKRTVKVKIGAQSGYSVANKVRSTK